MRLVFVEQLGRPPTWTEVSPGLLAPRCPCASAQTMFPRGAPKDSLSPPPHTCVSTTDPQAQAALISPESSSEPGGEAGICVSLGTKRFSSNFAFNSHNSCFDRAKNTSCYSRGSAAGPPLALQHRWGFLGVEPGLARVSLPPIQGSGAISAPPQPPTSQQDLGQRLGPGAAGSLYVGTAAACASHFKALPVLSLEIDENSL